MERCLDPIYQGAFTNHHRKKRQLYPHFVYHHTVIWSQFLDLVHHYPISWCVGFDSAQFTIILIQGAWNTAYQWSLGFVSPIITWVSNGFLTNNSHVQITAFIMRQIQSTLPSSMLTSSLSSPTLPPSANPAVLTAPHHTEIAGYSVEKVS